MLSQRSDSGTTPRRLNAYNADNCRAGARVRRLVADRAGQLGEQHHHGAQQVMRGAWAGQHCPEVWASLRLVRF